MKNIFEEKIKRIQIDLVGDEYQVERLEEESRLEQEFEEYLTQHPEDEDIWILYALFEAEMPLKDTLRGAEILKRLLKINPNNIKALAILADLQDLDLGGVDQETFKLLSNVKTNSKTEQAILWLLKSWYYKVKNDLENQTKCLQKSINFDSSLVIPYTHLGRLFLSNGQQEEGCKLIAKGLKNIVPSTKSKDRIENYINRFIKGITLSSEYINYFKETTDCDL